MFRFFIAVSKMQVTEVHAISKVKTSFYNINLQLVQIIHLKSMFLPFACYVRDNLDQYNELFLPFDDCFRF